VVSTGVAALERDRLSHVNQTYLRAETYAAANAPLIVAQSEIPLARAWGGGLVAAVDGMRFVVPVPTVYARPNRKYFGPKRGLTWLNMINDQAAGLGAKVISGTARDSLHLLDVLFNQDGGQRPGVIVADTGSYSDVVFGLLRLHWRIVVQAARVSSRRERWVVRRGSRYSPFHQASSRMRLRATAMVLCSRRVLASPR
jgi:TnpA family transposase